MFLLHQEKPDAAERGPWPETTFAGAKTGRENRSESALREQTVRGTRARLSCVMFPAKARGRLPTDTGNFLPLSTFPDGA